MRASALLNSDARGLLTDNENVVGEITVGGTLALVIFLGIFGGFVCGTVWVLVREWLPQSMRLRVASTGGLAMLTGSSLVINSQNPDFRLLDPQEIHIVMFVLLVGLTGSAIPVLDGYLKPRIPSTGTAAAIFGGLAGFGLILAFPLLVFSFFSDQDQNPSALAGFGLIAVAVATITVWVRYYASGESEFPARPLWLRRFGVASVVAFAVAGGIHLFGEIEAII